MKVYNQHNCFHECKVNFAYDICACIPWDFPLNISNSEKECDVFGRTCFFNAIKEFMMVDENICPQCLDACEFTQYHKTNILKIPLDFEKMYSWYYKVDGECGSNDFCEYLHDINHTIQFETWYEKIRDYEERKHPKFDHARQLLKDHIMVHVSFASPKVEFNVLDARYTFYDKLANLGGTIGISEQITGASFLTLIHLLVLALKAIFKFLQPN